MNFNNDFDAVYDTSMEGELDPPMTLDVTHKQELTVIDSREVFGKTLTIYGTYESPLFLAKDVAHWIEYNTEQVNKMLATVDEGEKMTRKIFWSSKRREMWFLTENGLYKVLMRSTKPLAKKFQNKICEILKEIRTTGSYGTAVPSMEGLSPLLQQLINSELKQKQLEQGLKATNQRIDDMRAIFQAPPENWRDYTTGLINRIADSLGGESNNFQDVRFESYSRLSAEAKVNLPIRLKNLKERMREGGAKARAIRDASTLDVIAEDKSLVPLYKVIVQKMAMEYGISDSEGITPYEDDTLLDY